MHAIRTTVEFKRWLDALTDVQGRARILARISRFEEGHMGDVGSVGSGVMEMRIHIGPGYRVYYTHRGKAVIMLLAGGDKRSQRSDIKKAIAMAATL